MTPDEQVDEAACNLLRCYMKLGEVALVIRTRGADVSTIMPNPAYLRVAGDRAYVAGVLRKAADSIEAAV